MAAMLLAFASETNLPPHPTPPRRRHHAPGRQAKDRP
eukprot:CAMPEP_0197503190 /NCGR_PEP_ID=MMETSP1312-20131121/2431_1 /TAXON_ID=464262 /ORGANISM="Genus nov. species nov., Strain RCC2335" /LENGTH=36 /DNA_ID= /DNA_START= /DNA_END= /DNA_ORIENTATION=